MVWRKRPDFRIKRWQRIRAQTFRRDDFTCQRCGWRPTEVPDVFDGSETVYERYGWGESTCLHLDHVTALANGGTNDPDNFQTLCEPCNCSKGGR